MYKTNINLIKHSGIQNLNNLVRTAASISFSNFGVFKEQNFKINVYILEQICLKYYLQVITLSFFPNKNLSTTFKIIYYFLANIYIFSLISPIN